MKDGRLIVFDGGEGAGKGTVLARLQKEFPPPEVLYTREPGGTPLAEDIRKILLSDDGGQMDPKTQFDLFWAARSDHLQHRIRPALFEGKHVICDRFDSSTFAYQICGHKNWPLKNIFWPMRAAHLDCMPAPFYIYLDVDPEEGLRRAHGRGDENHFDNQALAFHTRVREGYREFLNLRSPLGHSPLELAQIDPPIDGRIINANLPIDEVVENTIALVRILLA